LTLNSSCDHHKSKKHIQHCSFLLNTSQSTAVDL
jgi:hypothetical protein